MAALWAGALVGTALGQGLALRNVRGWFAAAIVGMVALVFAPMLAVGGAPAALWQALLPAALCGYWSLGERTAPAAFWFPAMTWMLTVVDRLDGDDAAATMDARAFVLLGGVAAAFLALLWAAERRRLGLMRSCGSAAVVPGRAATLREPAGRTLARAGWWAAVAASTLALTAWVAPHLWQSETLGGQQLTEFADGVGVGERDGVPCCPLVSGDAPRVRVREFLDVAHGVQRPPARVGVNCTACDRGLGSPAGGGCRLRGGAGRADGADAAGARAGRCRAAAADDRADRRRTSRRRFRRERRRRRRGAGGRDAADAAGRRRRRAVSTTKPVVASIESADAASDDGAADAGADARRRRDTRRPMRPG